MALNIIGFAALILGLTNLGSCGGLVVRQSGADLVLTCQVDGQVIAWKVNDGVITDGYTNTGGGNNKIVSTLERQNLSSADVGLYECYKNSDNSTIDTFNVTVLSISGTSENLVGNMSMAELSCAVRNMDVEVSEMKWMRDEKVVNDTKKYTVERNGTSTSLDIHMPGEEDAGLYTCVVTIEGEDTLFERNFSLNTPPNVQPIEKLRSKVEGEKATIVCNVTGFPTPQVEWFLTLEDSEDMQKIKYDERVNATAKDSVPNAILTINDLKIKTDRGDYMCVASNFLNTSRATVTLKVKDKLAAVWPFLGICAEVAILCSIIFIFEKRRNRRMEEEEEVDAVKQDLMNKSNGTDDKEVRQRSNATKA